MRSIDWALVVGIALAFAACSDNATGPNNDGTGDDPITEPEPDPDSTGASFCSEIGYPCTIDEADPAVGERSQALLEEAKVRVEAGQSNADVATWLGGQEGVADVTAQESLVVFRLDGGQPTWLLTSTPVGSSSDLSQPLSPHADDVVGHGTGRERADKKKKAIVLAPFLFQFGSSDVAPNIESILGGHRDYQGGVTLEANASLPALPANDAATTGSVTVDHFRGWGEYDVVALSTHGDVLVELGSSWGCIFTCIQGVATGERVRNCGAAIRAKYSGVPGVRCGGASGVEGTYIWLDSDFFRWEYRLAFALQKTILYVGACKTSALSNLALQLGSSTNEFFGWDDNVNSSHELGVATRLFQLMVNDGLTTKEAYERLESDGLTSQPSAELVLHSNGDGLHIREITTLKNPMHPSVRSSGTGASFAAFQSGAAKSALATGAGLLQAPSEGDLEDGHTLPFLGQAGDGENDELFFYVDVDGVRSGRESEFDVTLEVDEKELGTFSLDSDDAKRVDEYTVRLRIRQPLDFDIQTGQTMELKATTNIPGEEDGESEHKVSAVFQNPSLRIHSVIETSGGDVVTASSEVEGEIELTFREGDNPDELKVGSSIGPLEYVRFDIEVASSTGCTVSSQTVDGRMRIVEGMIPFDDPASSDWGVPDELLIFPLTEIREVVTLQCQGGSQTLDYVHWFAGFFGFHGGGFGHTNELDEDRAGLVISNWQAGSGDVYARRVYERTGQEDDVTATERTTLELRGPSYRPN